MANVMQPERVSRLRRSLGVAATACLAVITATAADTPAVAAAADAIVIRYVTKVSAPARPKIQLEAREPVGRVTVQLTRDDGKRFEGRFGGMRAGERREILLGEEPGTHRYEGSLVIDQGGAESRASLSLEAVVAASLVITVDRSRVDLAGGRMEIVASRPPARVRIVVHGTAGGAPIAEEEHDVTGVAAGAPFLARFSTGSSADAGGIARVDVKVTDVDGFFTGVSLHPWSVYIPHEEVVFATDSADIAAAEKPKLDRSHETIAEAFRRHRTLGPVRLFIAGHTDSVGKPAYNLDLSRRRARAIAEYFRRKGLRLPIAFEGFGEHAPVVGTADETDEPRNRRVDYILALEEPQLKAAGWVPQWKDLR
jgi:outer membrane protein OmpA-like peptidoglycan-associated protein